MIQVATTTMRKKSKLAYEDGMARAFQSLPNVSNPADDS